MNNIEVKVMSEYGYDEALLGLSLSYKDPQIPMSEWWTIKRKEKLRKTAKVLSKKGMGHNKFLESMIVYLDINMPRYWWSEFDTYRVGVTKNSESTMHKLNKRDVTQDDFCTPIPKCTIGAINDAIHAKLPIEQIKGILPEAYLQRRIVCANYKVLQNMIWQRETHRLPEWSYFIKRLKQSLLHLEFIE